MHNYIDSTRKLLTYYKHLGEQAMRQIDEADLHWQPTAESNSIAVIVKHLCGNMLSRWTNFLTTDGEKEWRDRESEFTDDITSATQLWEKWEAGWEAVLTTLDGLSETDMGRMVYVRNMGHTVVEAINRQLAHYAYHVGQIVYLARQRAPQWKSLSIPRGASATYNQEKFEQERRRAHFTDDFLEGGETA